MTEKFKKKIRKMTEEGAGLFYNGKGNPEAFKMCVRHIQTAENYGYGTTGTFFKPKKDTFLVDFEKETITLITEPLKIKPLKVLE